MKTVVIIGAGAAGLVAAGFAAGNADKVLLLEHNADVGRKLGITGKGRCNITNIAPPEDMIRQYPKNAKFLYSALYSFTNNDIIELLEKYGVKTKVERGGRVFPESDRASDVVKALKRFALQKNVRLIRADVKEILTDGEYVTGVRTDTGIISCGRVILCTGGMSYPGTGSRGDGYRMAEKLGHTITEIRPSLVPLVTEEEWVREVKGLSLRNVSVSAYSGKKEVFSEFGEMLFTHFGISGPVILSMSAHLSDVSKKRYAVEIDLKPALDDEVLSKRIIRDFEKYHKKQLLNSLNDLLPKSIIPIIIREANLNPHMGVSEFTRENRAALIRAIKHLTLHIKDFRPIAEAIVTSGGVKTGEINPATMESKLIKGLFFAGEIIDADGYTGGYNLQMAYSTAYLAGTSV